MKANLRSEEMFRAFYLKYFDTLLVNLSPKKVLKSYEYSEDITVLFDGEEIIGYNIRNAAQKFCDLSAGLQYNEEMVITKLKELGINIDYVVVPKFVVGEVIDIEKHPDANKLSICQVNIGSEVIQIVCGADNVGTDMKVPVALVGATMPSGLFIKKSKLRGVESNGMICSKKELGLEMESDDKGIWVMDSSLIPGTNIFLG